MDFTEFDHPQHIPALTWLGRKDWLIYKDLPAQRAVSAHPRKIIIKPKQKEAEEAAKAEERPILVGQKEFDKHPPEMWNTLKEITNVLDYDVVGTLWYNTLAKALADGPKIFRPTPEQCEALENAEARYSFSDYKQPFPVIILEIPQHYREILKAKYGTEDAPKFVLVNHDDKNKFIAVSAFYSKSNIITHITPDREEYKTIEDSLTKNRERRQDSVSMTPEGQFVIPGNPELQNSSEAEFDAAENVQRLAVNFAMMMSLYTVKIAGPLDPAKFKEWEYEARAVRRGGEPTNRAKEAQIKLAAALHVIEFEQHVEFYDEIEEPVEVGQGVDIEQLHKSPRSHWRRGHFVNQPCGVGNLGRKMIFRKPILVRAKYFLGDIKDSSVTYTMKPRLEPTPKTTFTPTQPPEPTLKPGDRIEIVSIEDSPIQPGTVGTVTKIIQLGGEILRIDFLVEEDQYSMIVPPDVYKVA